MTKTDLEKKEDELFYALDDILEQALWRQGRVYIDIKIGDIASQYTCTNIRRLKNALTFIATDLANERFPNADIDVEPIVNNILDECKHDIEQHKLPDHYARRW